MMLSEIATVLSSPSTGDIELSGICIDSRKIQCGNLFVAICGENFDGNTFIGDAIAKGAAAVLSNRAAPKLLIPQILVYNTTQALAQIAAAHRDHMSCKLIALTGSNGKTTVKEMIATILPKPSYATFANLNNHIGVPLSILELQAEHRYAVIELGASHLGEIAHTVAIAKPHVTLINNIAPAHIAGFGSIDGVASAKGEIHEGLSADGVGVINYDDAYMQRWDKLLLGKNKLYFSAIASTDISARDLSFDVNGCGQFILAVFGDCMRVKLQVPGVHNINNALAAAACAYAVGIDLAVIASGLCKFRGVSGRMSFLQGKAGSLIIDDSYNANLASSLAALEVLAKYNGRRIFVFGDMGELGAWSESHHTEVGRAALHHGIDVLMSYGSDSEFATRAYGARARHYSCKDELLADLLSQLDEHSTVLVKGSRMSKMEKIVQQITLELS